MKYLGNPQSGSNAQNTASRNRFGQYLRTRAMPVNPRTQAQTRVRGTLGEVASLWGDISEDSRRSWIDCAQRFPKVDALGQTIVLSAFQQFVRSNSALRFVGQAVQNSPKADQPFSNNVILPTVHAGTTKLFEIAYTQPSTGQFLVIDVSGQVSRGITFWSDYRNLAIQSSAGPSPAEELAKYEALYGPLVAGSRIWFRSRVLNECGVYGPAYETFTDVANTGPAAKPAPKASKGKV